MLLAAKANPSAKSEDGTTPLHTAAAMGRIEVVKALIAGKADLNARDMDGATPLHYAANKGTPEIYALLATAGADVDIVAQKGPYAGKTPRQMAKENFEPVRPDPARTKAITSMRILGLALHEFATKHGSFPNEATAKTLEKTWELCQNCPFQRGRFPQPSRSCVFRARVSECVHDRRGSRQAVDLFVYSRRISLKRSHSADSTVSLDS